MWRKIFPLRMRAPVVDVSSYYVTPGLIDINTHFDSNLNPDHNCLRNGVTTAVDAGDSPPKIKAPSKVQLLKLASPKGQTDVISSGIDKDSALLSHANMMTAMSKVLQVRVDPGAGGRAFQANPARAIRAFGFGHVEGRTFPADIASTRDGWRSSIAVRDDHSKRVRGVGQRGTRCAGCHHDGSLHKLQIINFTLVLESPSDVYTSIPNAAGTSHSYASFATCGHQHLVLAVSPAFPQATTANVVGTVTDPSGGVVPAATVTIRNRQTGQARKAQTDAQGNYEFTFLQIGEYSLTVEKPGFQKSEVAPFSLSVDQVARIDVRMTIGQSAESVQVSATAVLMQTENATVGTVIDSQKVVELPLNGRSFVQLALLDPGRESRNAREHHRAATSRLSWAGGRNVGEWRSRHAESLLLRRRRSDGSG